MKIIHYLIYFIIGGTSVCLVTYLTGINKGYWSAFIAMFPILALVPIFTIYFNSGVEATISYSQGLILMTLPFLLYASFFIWFLPYVGLMPSITIAAVVYLLASVVLNWVKKV